MKRYILTCFGILFFAAQIFATTHVVITPGTFFSPDSITITEGDTIHFDIDGAHTVLEVSQTTWDANDNTPLGGGFSLPSGGGLLTGVTVGTHYYVCEPHAHMGMKGIIIVQPAAQPVLVPNVWINEIHYDNAGTDTLEGYEIAGPAGTDLSCFRVILYNGSDGQSYRTDVLSGILPDRGCGFGTKWFALPANAIQNDMEGIVLEFAPTALACGQSYQDTILQFLSYEGAFAAVGGRAAGLTSTNIGVAENGTQPVGNSLQLGGTGTSYSEFSWQTSLLSTYDSLNVNQHFCVQPVNPTVEFVITSTTVGEAIGTFQLALSITNPNSNPTSVDINVAGGGTATFGDDFTFSPLTVTFPAGSASTQNVTVTIDDDALVEGNESFTLQLNFPTNNATIGTNAQHTVTILDNDALTIGIHPPSQMQFEHVGVANVPVILSQTNASPTSVTVQLDPVGTTATQGVDFFFNDTTVTWAAGTSGSIFVPITVVDDALYEQDETVRVILVNPTNGAVLGNDTFLLMIHDNDTMPSANCTDLFFSEYIHGTSNNKALEIFNPTSVPVNLNDYRLLKSTNGGTQISIFGLQGTLAPNDVYVVAHASAAAGILAQSDSVSSGFFNHTGNDAYALLHLTDTIDIIGELRIDPGANGWAVDTGSTFRHTLIRSFYNYKGDTNWTTAALTWEAYPSDMFDSLGFHHIAPCGTSQPIPPATIHFLTADINAPESVTDVPVVIQIDNPTGQVVSFTVAWDGANGTASPGSDYVFSNRVITTNNAGTTYDTVYITVTDDMLIEPTETAVLHFVNVTSANTEVIEDSVFTLYILDNDTLTVSFVGAGYSYVEHDTLVNVRVALSTFPTDTVTVSVVLAPGNTTNGSDFIFNDTTLVFLPNSADTQGVWIQILEDNIVESNEQINFDLEDVPAGIKIEISAYTLTIIDNDSTVGILAIDWENEVSMFPNPVSHLLNIQSSIDLQNVEITDLLGSKIISVEKLLQGRNSIDVSSLPAGMYFLKVNNDIRVYSKRFVKAE